jgi:hypothetical protein
MDYSRSLRDKAATCRELADATRSARKRRGSFYLLQLAERCDREADALEVRQLTADKTKEREIGPLVGFPKQE